MVSKEQERKALNEIKEVLLQLEPDGYVRTAFEGCFEIATDNINNDFACSMKQRAESAEQQEKELATVVAILRKQLESIKKDLEQSEGEKKGLTSMNAEMRRDVDGMQKKISDLQEANQNIKAQLQDKDAEIIRLKAQLFDYMMRDR